MSRCPVRSWFRSLTLALLGCTLLPGVARAQDQPSLAEQAAAARKATDANADSQVAGHVVMGEYRNDFFGFELKRPPGWEALNRGQMNVLEAVGRNAAGLDPGGDDAASSRVFGMHDGMGSSAILAITKVPPGADTTNLGAQFQQILKSQIPQARFQRETVLLGDSDHHFDAVRASYTLEGRLIVQSEEFILQKGHLIALTVTAPSQEKLTAVLKDLQTRLVWGGAAAGK